MADGTLITLTLEGTYIVRGSVTGYDYEFLPGTTVTVRNDDTGEDADTTVDESGAYSADLGNTTDFPSGYSNGDEIHITATHRGATRTWKRRVSGAEIVQDLPFTFGTTTETLRKAKMVSTEVFTGQTGFTLTLRDALTRDVLEVRRNGSVLPAADYSFTRPATLTMANALSATDVVEVVRATPRGVEDAKKAILAEGDPLVRDAISRHFTTPLPTRSPELQHLSEALAAARLRDEAYSSGDKVDADAKGLRERSTARLDELRKGLTGITDQDGAWITPSAQATTTPRSTITPTRRFTRWTDTEQRRNLW